MRRTDARRRKRDTPEGVAHCFQVSVYKVDPSGRSATCNLFAKALDRLALADEFERGGP
jgi:hypothetical protein